MSRKKVLAYIEPIDPFGADNNFKVLSLSGLYDNGKGSFTAITPSGEIRSIDRIYDDPKSGSNTNNYTSVSFTFGRESRKYEISIDANMSDEDTRKKTELAEKIIKAWSLHPQIVDFRNPTNDPEQPHYNPNNKVRLFRICRPGEAIKSKNSITHDRLKAGNMLVQMDSDELKSVFYFFGKNPAGMDKEELFDSLANFEGGHVMQEDNLKLFLDKFESKAEDTEMKIVINKAIQMTDSRVSGFDPIFEKRNTGYFLNGTYLGSDAEKVLAYFLEKENRELYHSYVVKSVKDREGGKKDATKGTVKQNETVKQKEKASEKAKPEGTPAVQE